MSASDDKHDDIMSIPGAGDTIDSATFEQILEMDDDEDEREFSKSIVYDFFQQAEATFKKMDTALLSRDKDGLKELSELGHFLKGSSATLGLTKVKDACEKIQNFGLLKDETGLKTIDEKESRAKLSVTILEAKDEFKDVERTLRRFYHDE